MAAITLLSDLGTEDASVSIAKAILGSIVPEASLIDISHRVEQYDLQQGAYLLLSAYKYFPQGSIHLLLIDVFSSDTPRMLVSEKEGHFFIAPDNGILALAFSSELQNTRLCLEFKKPYRFKDWISAAGKVAEGLSSVDNSHINYQPCAARTTIRLLQPKVMNDGVDCNILYIDRYENIVLDITKEQFKQIVGKKHFHIKLMRADDIVRVSDNYNDVKDGNPLCRFNNAGFLEIAFNHAPAATFLGLGSFSSGNLRYQTIKIFF